ncbi:MAG: hypothetical protein QXT91_05815 [Candidatus Caldarchaeum sp.]
MCSGRRAVSTAVASIAALAAVLAISGIATAMMFGKSASISLAASGRIHEAERKIPVRLSTVYHVPPALMISNDGTTPVRITRLYLDDGENPTNTPLRPGEKTVLYVGFSNRVAVEVEDFGVVVLQTVKPPSPPNSGGGGGVLTVEFRCDVSRIMPVTFMAIASGGQPPYIYVINYGDGGLDTYVGYVLLTQHLYQTLPATATVTVTDQANAVASSTLRVSLGGDSECSGVPPP